MISIKRQQCSDGLLKNYTVLIMFLVSPKKCEEKQFEMFPEINVSFLHSSNSTVSLFPEKLNVVPMRRPCSPNCWFSVSRHSK